MFLSRSWIRNSDADGHDYDESRDEEVLGLYEAFFVFAYAFWNERFGLNEFRMRLNI